MKLKTILAVLMFCGTALAQLPASVKYASQISGVSLDVDVTSGNKIGGGSATDNSALVNAYLATASASQPLVLYIDGPMGIKNTLDVTAVPNTTIECIGGGSIYALTGTNGDVIHNGVPVPVDQQTTAPARAGSLTIRGCTVYGNRGTYPAGNSSLASNGTINSATYPATLGFSRERGGLGGYTLGTLTGALSNSATSFTISNAIPTAIPTPVFVVVDTEILACGGYSGTTFSSCTRGSSVGGWSGQSGAVAHSSGVAAGVFQWYFGINIISVANLLIDHVHVYDAPTYGIRLNNVGPAYISHTQIEFSSTTSQVPNTDGIHVDGPANDVHLSDITVTLNGDDAIGWNIDEGYGGASSRLQASNITCDRCANGVRVYGNADVASKVSMSNFSGTFRDSYAILGFNQVSANAADGVASVEISDGIISSQSGNTMAEVVNLGGNVGSLTLSNLKWVDPNAAATCWFVPTNSMNASDIQLINSQIYQTTTGSGAPCVLNVANSNFKKVTISGYTANQQYGYSYSPTPYLVNNSGSGIITQLALNHVDPTNISQITSAGFAGITEVSGTGLTETGWYIPDANVLKDGTNYISASSGSPSIKFGGFTTAFPGFTGGSGSHFAAVNRGGSGASGNNVLSAASNAYTKPGTGSFTVFAFFNSNAFGTLLQLPISAMDASNVATNSSYYLGWFSANVFGFGTFDTGGTGYEADGTTHPTTNTWYCLAGTHDATTPGARVNKIWVNGTAETTLAAGASIYNGNAPFAVVGPANQTNPQWWSVNGKVAMTGKVSALLTSTQINSLCNGGSGRSAAEILSYFSSQGLPAPDLLYGFENTGSLGTDASGHGTTLSPTGTVTPGPGPRRPVTPGTGTPIIF